MGNSLNHADTTSICGFQIIPSANTLSKSSLHLPAKQSLRSHQNQDQTVDTTQRQDVSCVRDLADCPDSASPGSSASLSPQKKSIIVTANDFHVMQMLGKDSCGKVFLVKKDTDGKLYAMKIMGKKKAATLGCIESLNVERDLLEKAHYPSIPKLEYTFENENRVFLVMKNFYGGELKERLQNLTRFSEEITRFYAAEVLTTLKYLHTEMKIAYDDLRVEHIVLDTKGHIMFVDFAKSKCIDPDLISPETISQRKMLDFWQFGCLIYELLTGEKLADFELDEDNILSENDLEGKIKWPAYVSKTARDFIMRLLSSKVEERLGFSGFRDVQNHPFFTSINWDKIESRHVYPPISPHQSKIYEDGEAESLEAELGLNAEDNEPCELDDIMEQKPKYINSQIIEGNTFEGMNNNLTHDQQKSLSRLIQ